MKDRDKIRFRFVRELRRLRQMVAELQGENSKFNRRLQKLTSEYEKSLAQQFDVSYHAHDLAILVDVKTKKALQCSRAVVEVLGYSREEIIGDSIFNLYHQDCIEDAEEMFRVITKTGGVHDAEQSLRKRDGGKVEVTLNATTFRDEISKRTLARFDWRDISRLAEEVDDLRAEYRQLEARARADELVHPEAFADIITQDPAMHQLFCQVEAAARTKDPVLITGETGVGKERIAAIIHELSGRSGRYITENVAGLDKTLFSDTFFGHAEGAYTGASATRQGLIEQASGGTLFLDEIGDLEKESQIKLLRFLQEGEYRHLGVDAPIKSDVKIIAATNRAIESLLGDGSFRSDLYHRLETHHLHLPPLRERKGDIRPLALHFLEKVAKEQDKDAPTPPPELFTLLGTYHFPGNIRELESMVKDAVSQHQGGVLSMDAFLRKIDEHTSVSSGDAALRAGAFTFAEALSLLDKLPALKEMEEQLIAESMKRADGNQSVAARLMGLKKSTLNNRLRRAQKSASEA